MPVIPEHKELDALLIKAIGVGMDAIKDERTKIAEWWNANNTNEIVTGAYSGTPWDELPEWAQESAIKLYRSCRR